MNPNYAARRSLIASAITALLVAGGIYAVPRHGAGHSEALASPAASAVR